jgi:hypothetical protein
MGVFACEDLPMCDRCCTYHATSKATASHTSLSLKPPFVKGPPKHEARKVVGFAHCAEHDEPKKFFCSTHLTAICRDCTVVDHCQASGCMVKNMAQAAAEQRESIRPLLAKLEEHMGVFIACDDVNKGGLEALVVQEGEAQKWLTVTQQRMHALVDQVFERAKAETAAATAAIVEGARAAPEAAAARSAVKQAESLVDMTPELLESSDAELLEGAAETVKEISRLLSVQEADLTALPPTLTVAMDVAKVEAMLLEAVAEVTTKPHPMVTNPLLNV